MRPLLYFTESVWVDGKGHVFSFGEKLISTGRMFWVATLENNDPIVFEIAEDAAGNWKIVTKIPDWIRPFEQKLIEILKAKIP